MSRLDRAAEGPPPSPPYACGKFLIFNSIRGGYPFQTTENKEVTSRFLILKVVRGGFWLLQGIWSEHIAKNLRLLPMTFGLLDSSVAKYEVIICKCSGGSDESRLSALSASMMDSRWAARVVMSARTVC